MKSHESMDMKKCRVEDVLNNLIYHFPGVKKEELFFWFFFALEKDIDDWSVHFTSLDFCKHIEEASKDIQGKGMVLFGDMKVKGGKNAGIFMNRNEPIATAFFYSSGFSEMILYAPNSRTKGETQ